MTRRIVSNEAGTPVATADDCRTTAPPMHRSSMVARPWRGFLRSMAEGTLRKLLGHKTAPVVAEPAPWEHAARLRRRVLIGLILMLTAGASALMLHVQPPGSSEAVRYAQAALFGLLFAWVSAGFATALMGFYVHCRGDKHSLSRRAVEHQPVPPDARTAIIMPICNEHVATVFAGLRATCESLEGTGAGHLFDVYVLSDTSDPELRRAEVAAWSELRETLGDDSIGARVFYRWRRLRSKRKAGNVADFCRRWGRNYRYMVVLDADSVMSGDCLLTLVRLMQAHPQAGIIQTAPQAVGLSTLHARAQQFATRVMGRLFTLGMQYWQLGESHYWGHNAIIRVEPFMKHCALAPIRGTSALSGEIMSHDFVEAALMRRAGYHVWLAGDLGGSYEQQPPNLIEELQRDRRWCHGNLQNARLIAEPGLHPVHRAMLATGAMAYASAPLWLTFLALGAILGPAHSTVENLPIGLASLWGMTLTLLMLPRLLAVLAVVIRKEQRFFGGTGRLVRSALLEAGLSVLQAPVRMAAHSVYVLGALTGWRMGWKSPPREALALEWRDAWRCFMPACVVTIAVLSLLAWAQPQALPWLAPVCLPLLLAAPLAVLTSHAGLSERLRNHGALSIPEEAWPPTVLRRAWAYSRRAAGESAAQEATVPAEEKRQYAH